VCCTRLKQWVLIQLRNWIRIKGFFSGFLLIAVPFECSLFLTSNVFMFMFVCFLTFSAWHWFVGAVKQKGFLVGALGCLGDLKVYLRCCLRPLLEAFIGRNEESGATTGRWLTICIARSLLAPDEDSSTLLINTHHHQHREAGILVQYSPQLSLLSLLS